HVTLPADVEAAKFTGRRAVVKLHPLNFGGARPAMQETLECLERMRRPFGDRLDRAIRAVEDKACQAKLGGGLLRRGAEINALHASIDDGVQAARFFVSRVRHSRNSPVVPRGHYSSRSGGSQCFGAALTQR